MGGTCKCPRCIARFDRLVLAACCRKGELLAIWDDDDQHRQLVRFYSRFGWKPVVEVSGGRLSDLPHMLVWGGAGTRMDIDLPSMVRSRWVRALRQSEPRG